MNLDLSFLLNGKSLKELNFPADWEYEFDMRRWKSENKKVKITRSDGSVYYKYIYITDSMLSKLMLRRNP